MSLPVPVGNTVIIEADPWKEKSDGGILMPSKKSQEAPWTATVIAVGPGHLQHDNKKRDMSQVKAGDRVIFKLWTGWKIRQKDGRVFIGVNIDDIWAILE